MIQTRTIEVCGITYLFEIPPTTRDILEWQIWILCIQDPEEHRYAAMAWALKWIRAPEFTIDQLAPALIDLADENPAATFDQNLAALCSAIARSAELPPALLRDLQTLRDKQNGIDPQWNPRGACGCPRCRGRVQENPEGWDCLYDDIDRRSVRAAAATAGVGDGSEPYYLVQLRDTEDRARSRRLAKMREDREEKNDFLDRGGRAGLIK